MNTLKLHEEFHLTFGQPILDDPNLMDHERNKLRIKLAFEELAETAVKGFGLAGYFAEFCQEQANKNLENTFIIDKKEVLDGLVDIQVINNGTILESGFRSVFHDAYKQTHDNNMSKAHPTLCEAEKTITLYKEKGEDGIYYKNVNNLYVAYRKDGKVVKPYNYVSNDLSNFVK